MKLSKEYLSQRLLDTTPHALATELTDKMEAAYKGTGLVQRAATIAKFEAMLTPLAPKTIKATDFMEANGITVVRVA